MKKLATLNMNVHAYFQSISFQFKGDDIPRKNPGKGQKRWNKKDLLEWLEPKNVLEEGRRYTVPQLWELITPLLEGSDIYTAERIMSEHGVKCLRLPP